MYDVDFDNTVISKLFEKIIVSSRHFIGYLDGAAIPLVLIWSKISGYVKTLKYKDGDKDDVLLFI